MAILWSNKHPMCINCCCCLQAKVKAAPCFPKALTMVPHVANYYENSSEKIDFVSKTRNSVLFSINLKDNFNPAL